MLSELKKEIRFQRISGQLVMTLYWTKKNFAFRFFKPRKDSRIPLSENYQNLLENVSTIVSKNKGEMTGDDRKKHCNTLLKLRFNINKLNCSKFTSC